MATDPSGDVLISPHTPLSRLNYFDGKFLKAADLELEQRYLRSLVALSNQGLGWGVVYGFDTTGGGDTLSIGPGLAIDAGGNLLYLLSIQTIRLDIAAVISSMYPGTTVLLASVVQHEKLSRLQPFGIALCLLAIAFIAAA